MKHASLNFISKVACTLTFGLCISGMAHAIGPSADAYIESGTPNANYGPSSTLLVRQTNNSTNLSRASYIHFDLSTIPPPLPVGSGRLLSAVLRLYGRHETSGVGIPVDVRLATTSDAWGEAALTWNNASTLAPVSYASPPFATTTIAGGAAAWYEWDITALVNAKWTTKQMTVALYTNIFHQYRVSFNSKEAATNRPQLIVTFSDGMPRCPENYQVKEGLNTGFPTSTGPRAFVLKLPRDLSTPRPLWVPLTSAVESTTQNLNERGGNAKLIEQGFIVLAPIRRCANQNPDAAGTSVNGGTCNARGTGGFTNNAWQDSRTYDAQGELWKRSEGYDSRFIAAAVSCVSWHYRIDQRRLYIGGIGAGGTMTNRALLFGSDLWAGGVAISGEWYVTRDDGTAYPGTNELAARNAAVSANPTGIFQSRVGHYPLLSGLHPMIVITLWGGTNDQFSSNGSLVFDARPATQASSNYFNSIQNVLHIACSSTHGHQWPTINRDAFNVWALTTLASHRKGTPKADFILKPPPSGYNCRIGAYRDHYAGT